MAFSTPGRADDVSVTQVLARAGAYVSDFERHFSGIVAEEHYEQTSGGMTRKLTSDVLLVRVPGDAMYVQYRDVFEVDGSAVRTRSNRIAELFQDPSASAADRLRAITEESARYNIGRVQRTINTPTLARILLRPDNQLASTFKLSRSAEPELARAGAAATAFAVPRNTVVLSFQEKPHDTLVRTTANRDAPSHGRFWIDPDTGTVLNSELEVDLTQLSAVVDVHYSRDATLGIMAPVEMRERYAVFGGVGIQGVATYSHLRAFQVQVSSDVQSPK